MFIMRLILLLVIVAVLMWLLKRLFSTDSASEKLEEIEAENMKQCKYCGVHIPESASLTVDNETYCSQEHADLDRN